MAEGWARALKPETLEPYSAGVEVHGLNPDAVFVMKEVGVDISAQKSTHVNEFLEVPLDYVVTVCDHAKETCPVFPGLVKRIHKSFEDPPRLAKSAKNREEALNHYRRVRDNIRAFIETLPESLEDT